MGLPGYFSLGYPQALALGALLAYLYVRHLPNKNLWRVLLLALAALLLCYPSLVRASRNIEICLLMDRSRSISDEARAKQLEILDFVKKNVRPGDKVGIVSFNERSHIEKTPDAALDFSSFEIPYSEDASDLADGIETAMGLLGERRNARIYLLSDGEYTGQSPIQPARVAKQNGIAIDYRDLKRTEVFNLSVSNVNVPDKSFTNEFFRIEFRVHSTMESPGRYRLYRNGQIIGRDEAEGWRSYAFQAGENLIRFVDALENAGIHSYRLEVEAIPKDREAFLKDNLAERFVQAIGERPLLLVNNDGAPDNVSSILSAGNLPVHVVGIGNFRLDIRQLEGYKGVILNNVPILDLTRQQIESLRRFVTEEGGGLLVCGGNRSFASGGFYKTALEDILPVSLEDRQQSKKVSTAFSIILDRSGSMQMPTPSGETKMSLANNAAAECIRLMSAVDSVSVIAVDSLAHIIVPQQSVERPGALIQQVLSIRSMGGGIFVYTGLAAATTQIIKAPQLNKHILLFADAADSEEPGDYINLLEKFRKAGITVSVVGLGTEKDVDAEFLKDIAKRGEGSAYFTEDAAQLVQFFTADTITYTRERFIEEVVPVTVRAAAFTISPEQKWQDFSCGGYNLLFPKPEADVAMQTADEDQAPLLAFWQRGLGRCAALAFDPNRAFAETGQYGDVMLGVARWILGSNVQDNLQIRVDYQGTNARILMEVSDEERERIGAPQLRVFTPGGGTVLLPMNWDSQNRLSASVKISEPGLHRGVVQIGDQTYKTGPISIPVSPEFLTEHEPDFGRNVLRDVAAVTGGRRVQDVSLLFERKGSSPVVRPVVYPFLLAFLILFLLEIAEPRFALLPLARQFLLRSKARLMGTRLARQLTGGKTVSAPRGRRVGRQRSAAMPGPDEPGETAAGAEADKSAEGAAPAAGKKPPPAEAEMDYLAQSKARARKRFE